MLDRMAQQSSMANWLWELLLQEICESWKLRTPNELEPLQWWSQLLSWRNQARQCFIPCAFNCRPSSQTCAACSQVYNLTIRQFGALQSIAPNMHQMGYR
jgi:transformation/transcription domain-associated protein